MRAVEPNVRLSMPKLACTSPILMKNVAFFRSELCTIRPLSTNLMVFAHI